MDIAKVAGGIGTALVVGGVLGALLFQHTRDVRLEPDLPPPDTPPAEFLYLDAARVLTYDGQLEGGLSEQEQHSFGLTNTLSAQLAGGGAQVGGSTQQQVSQSATVRPRVADRFYRFLRLLREPRGGTAAPTLERASHWLNDLRAQTDDGYTPESVRRVLDERAPAGTFLRVSDALLCLPPYAAALPKLSYVPTCTGRRTGLHPPLARAASARGRAIEKAYLRRLGGNPVLPFVAQTLDAGSTKPPAGAVTFLMPTPYKVLTPDPVLLSGPVTIVGKVVYVDAAAHMKGKPPPPPYIDRGAEAGFAPALAHSRAIRTMLDGGGDDARRLIRRDSTFRDPIAVVLPLAIYVGRSPTDPSGPH